MNTALKQVADGTRRVLGIQIITGVLVALVFALWQGVLAGASALWGSVTIVISTALLARSVRRSAELAVSNPKGSMAPLYVAAVYRFLLVLGMLAVGLGVFKLDPVATFVGLLLTQAGYVIGGRGKAPVTK